MNIPVGIKELFRQTSIEKNMRIHFPNGERPDICNDNIVEESAVFEQSICSQDNFRFGLCESSIFEASVYDIEEKKIYAKTVSDTEFAIDDSRNRLLLDLKLYGKAEQTQYSGKNLLENTATTTTINGVTFTVNEDGSVTVNGTATANAFFKVSNVTFPDGEYILTGCPDGGSASGYSQIVYQNGKTSYSRDAGDGVNFSSDGSIGTNDRIEIKIRSGLTVDNLTFYPMIRLSSIEDSTYEPYVGGIASPNPDYPQEIQHVEFSNLVITNGAGDEQTIAFSEPVTMYASGDVKDEIYKQDGKWGIMRRFATDVFGGMEETEWAMFTTTKKGNRFKNTLSKYSYANTPFRACKGYCTHFGFGEILDNATASQVGVYSNIVYFYHDSATVDDFVAWLSENSVTLVYQLETTVFEEFDETIQEAFDALETYYGTTRIYTDSTFAPEIYAEYVALENAEGSILIDNPNPLRGNIKGLEIEVSLEVDISSLSDEIIVEYGKMAADVPFPYFEIPKGRYTVHDCRKEAGNDARQIVAYDKTNSESLDVDISGWLKYYKNGLEIGYGNTMYDVINSLKSYYGIYDHADAIDKILPLSFYSTVIYDSADDYENRVTSSGAFVREFKVEKNALIPYISNMYALTSNIVKVYTPYVFMRFEKIPPEGVLSFKYNFNMDEVARYNSFMNALEKTNLTVDERLDEVKALQCGYITLDARNEIQDVNRNLQENHFKYTGFAIGNLLYCCRAINVKYDVVSTNTGTKFTSGKTFSCIESVEIYRYPDDYIEESKSDFEFATMPLSIDVETLGTESVTLRNLLSAICEINCTFGKIGSLGNFLMQEIGKPYWKLSMTWELPEAWVLNYSDYTRIPEGEEESCWYDEDYATDYYGRVRIVGDEVETEYIGNANGTKSYDIADNVILNNGMVGKWESYDILKSMYKKLQGVSFTPMELKAPHNPLCELGDEVYISDEGKEVKTYILNRVTTGIVSMADEIDTSNIQK